MRSNTRGDLNSQQSGRIELSGVTKRFQTPDGTGRGPTSRIAQQVSNLAMKTEGVSDVVLLDGFNILNSTNPANASVECEIVSPEGRAVAQSRQVADVPSTATETVNLSAQLSSYVLWSPESPRNSAQSWTQYPTRPR